MGPNPSGVQRQYSGTAGRIENCQVGVFLAYAGVKGRTLLDRELYLPQVWARDWERRREAGVPDSVGLRTNPQLAQLMLGRTLESGVPFSWFTGDEVYGSDRNLRTRLEREEIPHVMPINSNEKLWAWTGKRPLHVRTDRLTSGCGIRLGAAQCREWRQGTPGLRLGCGGNPDPLRAWQGAPAADAAQHCQPLGSGLSRLLWNGGNGLGGAGWSRREALNHRGVFWTDQRTGGL